MNTTVHIVQAKSEKELDEVRKLIREFVSWHRDRHAQDMDLINAYFDEKKFEEELQDLPGTYAPPRGRLLLAYQSGEPAGCVALREISEETCEMKRMFVYAKFHGNGIGRALARQIIQEGRSIGYSKMKLDTSIRQVEAIRLYTQMGFRRTEAYYPLPPHLENWLVFMELNYDT